MKRTGSLGAHILRISLLLNFSIIVLLLTLLSPNTLASGANAIFYWENNAVQQAYSFAGLLIGMAFLIYSIAERSIKREGEYEYRQNQAP